ncbi:MAG: PQQ-dependent sugar dehydrogenase, partial [Melioribacteraceae bacterium]
MRKKIFNLQNLLFVFLYLVSTSLSTIAQTSIVEAFPNLSFARPVDIQNAGDNSDRIFIVEQAGRIIVFQNNEEETNSTIFLDIKEQVNFGGEQGLLGLAFHPNYKTNGYFFLNYTASNPKRTVIARFTVSDNDSNIVDINSK